MSVPDRPLPPEGLLVVDKPTGWTSHDVVGRTRRLAGTRKVGHAGTLDPMATGVLVLGIGRATRLLTFLVGADKEYLATVRLGVTTSTEDADGEVVDRRDASQVSPDALSAALGALTGPILQVPSAVSAIKVDGRRSYDRVRAGERVELPARPVTVTRLEVLARREGTDAGGPVMDLDLVVGCSSGTYVRALARDLGEALGVGGHLTALRRTRVGSFALDAAEPLSALEERREQGLELPVLPLEAAVRGIFAVLEVDEEEARALSHGRRIPGRAPVGGALPEASPSDEAGSDRAPVDAVPPATPNVTPDVLPPSASGVPAAAFAPDGSLIALVERAGDRLRPTLVFRPA